MRPAYPGLVYHVVNRGNNRRQIFSTDGDYEKYLELIRRYRESYGFRLYHYVLMGNHIHLLLETTESGTISKIMQCLTLAHTKYHNWLRGTSGHVWEGRFRSSVIDRDAYLLQCGRYIELNPVRASVVDDPARYPWSSYRFYAMGEENDLVHSDPLYEECAATPRARQEFYRGFVMGGVPEEVLSEIRRSISIGDTWGRESFVRSVQERTGSERRVHSKRRRRRKTSPKPL